MSGFIADNSTYNINTDYAMSVILSHFNEEYIYSTIKNWIKMKYEEPYFMINNIILGYNENFKQLLYMYQNDADREAILDTRNRVYKDIIELLCNEFQLEYNLSELDNNDLYTPAFYLFRLLVSEFVENVKMFFVNFILKEKNNLYSFLNLDRFKRDKDTNTIYNKKKISNSKLAIIISKLGYVVDNICVMDISFQDYLNNVYQDQNIINYLLNLVSSKNDFFKTYVAPLFAPNSLVKASILGDITILLYNIAGNNIGIDDLIDEEE